MLTFENGNLLDSTAEALVNTVNCVGVMGKGIALQFKKMYPRNYEEYRGVCDAGEMHLGKVLVHEIGSLMDPKYIINFPTKDHWKGNSKIQDISSGLESLKSEILARNIKSIAVPPLGCGNGGLDWMTVRTIIVDALMDLEVDVHVFEPGFEPSPHQQRVNGRTPRLTKFKAKLLALFHHYGLPGHEITALEAQKLAWFLGRAGDDTRLNFEKGTYGPYSERLNHPLQQMDGHYITGAGDRSKIESRIVVLPNAVESAKDVLIDSQEDIKLLNQVFELIEGYETPYGMELLSTVDWVATQENPVATNSESAHLMITNWSSRKANLFPRKHIDLAWNHLQQQGWRPGCSDTRN